MTSSEFAASGSVILYSTCPGLRVTLKPVHGQDSLAERSLVLKPNESIQIGRASKAATKHLVAARDNLWIDSPVISRTHAELTNRSRSGVSDHLLACQGFRSLSQAAQIFIKDQSSMHGTMIDHHLLSKETEYPLRSGDHVTFGQPVKRGSEDFLPPRFSVYYSTTPSRDDDFAPKQHSNAGRNISVPDGSSDEEDSDRDSVEYGSDDESRSSVSRGAVKLNREDKIISDGKMSSIGRTQIMRTESVVEPAGSHSNPLDVEAEHKKKHTIILEEDFDEGPDSEPIVKEKSTSTVLLIDEAPWFASDPDVLDAIDRPAVSGAYGNEGAVSDGRIEESAVYSDGDENDEDSVVGAEFDNDIRDADAHSERPSSPEVASDAEDGYESAHAAMFSETPTQSAPAQPDTVRMMKLDDILQNASVAQRNPAESVSAVSGHVDKHSDGTPSVSFTHNPPQACAERQYSGLSDLKRDNILHEQDRFALGDDNWDDSFLDSPPPPNVYNEGPFAMPKAQAAHQKNRPLAFLQQQPSIYPDAYEAYQWPATSQACAPATSPHDPWRWSNAARPSASIMDRLADFASALPPSVLSSDAKVNSKIAIADILHSQNTTAAVPSLSSTSPTGTKRKANDIVDCTNAGNTTEQEPFADYVTHPASVMNAASDPNTNPSTITAVESRPAKKQRILNALPRKRSKLRAAATAVGYLVAGSIGGIVALAALPESLFQ